MRRRWTPSPVPSHPAMFWQAAWRRTPWSPAALRIPIMRLPAGGLPAGRRQVQRRPPHCVPTCPTARRQRLIPRTSLQRLPRLRIPPPARRPRRHRPSRRALRVPPRPRRPAAGPRSPGRRPDFRGRTISRWRRHPLPVDQKDRSMRRRRSGAAVAQTGGQDLAPRGRPVRGARPAAMPPRHRSNRCRPRLLRPHRHRLVPRQRRLRLAPARPIRRRPLPMQPPPARRSLVQRSPGPWQRIRTPLAQ
jgi:hypothetical protein